MCDNNDGHSKSVFGWAVIFGKATMSFELLKSCCGMWALRNPKVIWLVTRGFWKKKLNGFQKSVKARGEVLLDLYYEKSCFWAKALVAFGPFGWLLAFTKAKAGSKAPTKGTLILLPSILSWLIKDQNRVLFSG